jgi:uncharacterized protein (TIGR02246 family)
MRTIPSFVLVVLLTATVAAQTAAQDATEADAVKRIVEATTSLSNEGKLEELLALYSDDAKIDSKAAGRQVTKEEYREAVKRVWSQRAVNRADVGGIRVTMVDATRAVVDGVIHIHLTNGGRTGGKNQWKLEKRDGRWLIVESKYQ